MEKGDISRQFRQAFVVYLASASKPISEYLDPNLLDQEKLFHQEFLGMTAIPIAYDELVDTRKKLVAWAKTSLTDKERQFLLSIKLGDPDWSLVSELDISELPALKWKIINIRKMPKKKHQETVEKLKNILEL